MELNTLKCLDKKYAQAIANYLLERIETDVCLKDKLIETSKTLKGCINYIKQEARKQAEENVAILCDEDVYQMAVHYFLEDSLNNEQTKPFKAKSKENEDEDVEDVEDEEETSTKPVKPSKKKVEEKLNNQLNMFDFL